ncbi:hypothetical protein VMCG_03406 [Cytospora schulzeri]|uniref:Pex N-terminal domain-containing protein n=1 Tax=Cytospora schulzeri TaxID=448051 RepID=A0A423WWT2_9PEZI|nr:hypothetical protein VMCG_03406 [Valsa malicola]
MTNPTFAQAQQRLAERRQARESQARIQQAAAASASQLRSRISSHPSPLLRRLGGGALSLWDAASSREGTRPAFRVGQVDAELLDEELVQLLRDQVGDALRYAGGLGANLKDEWAAEILLVLRAALFKLTVWDHDATYGAALQNLKYTDARSTGPVLVPPTRVQKALYGMVTVGGKYAWTRLENWLLNQDNGFDPPSPRAQRLSRLASVAESAHAVAAFASFLVFLLHGRYRTLLDRILRMRLAPPTSQVSREVSFEYLNRQLVWHAFTEFLLFVLPLIGINKWRRWLSRTWKRTKGAISSGGDGDADADAEVEKRGEFSFLPERTCAICYQDQNSASTEQEVLAAAASSGVVGSAQTDITNPYETIPCGCVYCFVCLATRIEGEEGEGWTCLRCGEVVRECKPWGGDVLEPPASRSPTATKGVMFADDVKEAPTETESSQADFVDAVEDMAESTSTIKAYSSGDEDGSGNDDSEEYDEEESELGDDYI